MHSLGKLIQRLMGRLFQLAVEKLAGGSADKTHLEVERKFRVSESEAAALAGRLAELGFAPAETVDMTDTFLPAKSEGDMVRVRTQSDGRSTRILLTLKSWIETPDGGKERKETEGEIRPLTRSLLFIFGRRLSGTDLLEFTKHRRHFEGMLGGRQSVVSIDSVDGLGEYSGLYLEVEVLVPVGEDVQPARREIAALVARLFGSDREMVKMSYMDMLRRARGLSKE